MGPKVQSPPDSLGKAVNQFARAFATEENAHEAKRIAQEFLDHNFPGTSKYLPTDPQIHGMMSELRRGLGLPSGPVPGEVAEHRVPKDYLPLPAENSSGGEPALPGSESQTHFSWLPLPTGSEARQAMGTLLREAFPGGTLHQDSLNLFFKNPEMQTRFQGNQSAGGAAAFLSKAQGGELLSLLSVKLPSPEMARAFDLLQTLLPALLSENPSGHLEIPLQSWLETQVSRNTDLLKVLGSFAELLEKSGLASSEGIHDLLLALANHPTLAEIAATQPGTDALKILGQQFQGLSVSTHPLVQGLNHFMQGNLLQGLNQMIQPLIRLLAGLFMMKPETAWSRSLPNENVMARLATLFASQAEKAKERKERKKRRLKKRQGYGPSHPFDDENVSGRFEEEDEAITALAS